jgi:N-methylhydantoinase A
MGYRIAVDTGGTFTDLGMVNEETGELVVTKVPSTPDDPGRAVLTGVRELMETYQITPERITFLLHGTTVATNALLERKGARIGLITTAGFRDILQIGRQVRPRLYDHRARKPAPLVPRHLCFEVRERMLPSGAVHTPLNQVDVQEVAARLREEGVEAVAICLLHSYANPEHELRIRDAVAQACPDAFISLSVDVLPEFREYERMSTIAVNAYVMPRVNRYVANLARQIADSGVGSDLYIMQSNGGVITAHEAQHVSARTVLSGPAGGALAGTALADQGDWPNLITVDMGGTSLDICLIHDRKPRYTTESEIGGCPLKLPMIEIHTIGAGGGSLAWIDSGGAMRVGPHSAGAIPGPACYRKGGTEPTVTDANVVLGRINPRTILGGRMCLDAEAARRVIQEKVAAPLGLSVETAAEGVISVVNANMVRGIRVVSVEKGYDPRDFALVAFGGAGPVHAVEMARELGMRTVIVPPRPGITSAVGMLRANVRHDYVRTYLTNVREADVDDLTRVISEMIGQATEQLTREGFAKDRMVFELSADLRYAAQAYELNVPIAWTGLDQATLEGAVETFHEAHQRSYGYCRRHDVVELVNIRVVALGRLPAVAGSCVAPVPEGDAFLGKRPIYLDGEWLEAVIYRREGLEVGTTIAGPAVIEQLDATTVLFAGQRAAVDRHGNLVVRLDVVEKGGAENG